MERFRVGSVLDFFQYTCFIGLIQDLLYLKNRKIKPTNEAFKIPTLLYFNPYFLNFSSNGMAKRKY